ncbi:MAG: purine-nucleoside phosphorylase [Deltaproteobacteria bacterium]|nr:purine-nucleoside phosphorylase [Deltaproteobacteria bacterium]
MFQEIHESCSYILAKFKVPPEVGLITGTGLGNIADCLKSATRIPYNEIPYFPISTVAGHKGVLMSGTLAGKQLIVMEGRFHAYEGYTPEEIAFPVRVMSKLGIKYLFISSAAGGLNPNFRAGDLMAVTDHINLTGQNPLIGMNTDHFGPRFPDMTRVYNPALIELASKEALKQEIQLNRGVYVGVTGPSLETPAETRFLRMIGADAVGMSTVHEVIVAAQCGLQIMVIVAITNVNLPDCMEKTSIEKIIEVANSAGSVLAVLWEKIIGNLPV